MQGIKDVVGTKVAVQRGNVAEYTLLLTLEKEGIAKDQVQEVYIAVPDAAAALAQKKVDAWVTWDPYISIAEIDKTARSIFDGRDAPDFGVWIVRNDFLQGHPEAVTSVLSALKLEGDWANANVLKAVQIEGAEAKLPDAVTERMATRPRNYAITSIDDKIEPQMQSIATWMSDGKVIPKSIDLNAYVVKNLVKG
jgi:sulfonate transport system substrate-binding protein